MIISFVITKLIRFNASAPAPQYPVIPTYPHVRYLSLDLIEKSDSKPKSQIVIQLNPIKFGVDSFLLTRIKIMKEQFFVGFCLNEVFLMKGLHLICNPSRWLIRPGVDNYQPLMSVQLYFPNSDTLPLFEYKNRS